MFQALIAWDYLSFFGQQTLLHAWARTFKYDFFNMNNKQNKNT